MFLSQQVHDGRSAATAVNFASALSQCRPSGRPQHPKQRPARSVADRPHHRGDPVSERQPHPSCEDQDVVRRLYYKTDSKDLSSRRGRVAVQFTYPPRRPECIAVHNYDKKLALSLFNPIYRTCAQHLSQRKSTSKPMFYFPNFIVSEPEQSIFNARTTSCPWS